MNYLTKSGINILMKGITQKIWMGAVAFWLVSCGAEVAKEQIHELPTFNAAYYNTALEALNERIENAPENPDAYFKKGQVLGKLNNPDNAIINLKKAIKLDSLNPGYYKSLANVFFQQGKMNRAEENALKALQLGDQTAEIHRLLADVYINNSEFTIALNHLNKAIETAPGNSAYTLSKASLYMQLGDTTRAKEYLMGNLFRIKAGTEVYGLLSDIFLSEKKYEQAIAYLDSSILVAEKPKKGLLIKKAEIFQRSGNVSAAKYLLNQQLKEDSTNFALRLKLAELHLSSYGYDSAIYYLNRAIMLNSNSKEAFLLMGKVYDKKRMYLTAQDQFKNALLIDTSFQEAKQALAEMEKKLAYIQRQKYLEATKESNPLPQLETIKPGTDN